MAKVNQARRQARVIGHCHPMIRETAIAMAHELYDTLMRNDSWYRGWKFSNPGASPRALESRFVAQNWGKLVENARATLAGMLNGPLDPDLKEGIYEALILDGSLKFGRGGMKPLKLEG